MTLALRSLLTLLFALALVIGAILFLRRLGKRRQDAFLRFQREGVKVTGTLTQVRHIRGVDSAYSQLRHRRVSGRYAYYTFPGGEKHVTRRYTAPQLPSQVEFYIDPQNPRRCQMPWEEPQGPGAPAGLGAMLAVLVCTAAFYRLLGML